MKWGMYMKKVEQLEQPLNANERFLYAVAMRLEILIDQVSAISEHLATRDNVAVTSNVATEKRVEEKVQPVAEVKPKVTRSRKKV